MNQKKSLERKKTFGIRTSKMSDEVYAHLEGKSKNNQLAQYIIELVEKDLSQSELELDFKGLTKEVADLRKAFKSIKKVTIADDLSIIPTEKSFGELDEVSDQEVNSEGFDESIDFSDY